MEYNIKTLKEKIKQEGFFSVLKKIFKYINKNICGAYIANIYEYDLKNNTIKDISKLDLSFRFGTKEDLKNFDSEEFEMNSKSKKYLEDRLDQGDRYIIAIYKNKIVGFFWIMKDLIALSEYNFKKLREDMVYFYNAFVVKKYRGNRICQAMNAHLCRLSKKNNKRKAITLINRDNKASIKQFKRMGCRKIGKIIKIRFFGLKIDYINKKDKNYLLEK